MVQQADPRFGEIVLDPACGTGGFLVEMLGHLVPQIQTAQQRRELHNNVRGTPFGGAEEANIRANFPAGKRAVETAWLYLQLVIRQLKDGGRCGIVVPHTVCG